MNAIKEIEKTEQACHSRFFFYAKSYNQPYFLVETAEYIVLLLLGLWHWVPSTQPITHSQQTEPARQRGEFGAVGIRGGSSVDLNYPKLYPHLTQKTMLAPVLQTSASANASPKCSSSGTAGTGGSSWTGARWDADAWRWTTNAARPSNWPPVSTVP